jgi:putative ABC transport system permease protein
MQERMSDMSSTLTLFLTGIAIISLNVGAIGVANSMFTSVLEKQKK